MESGLSGKRVRITGVSGVGSEARMKAGHSISRGRPWIGIGIGFLLLTAFFARAGSGLSVSTNGTLQRYGRPYRAVGVNFYDAFQRALETEAGRECDSGFALLEMRDIPFARFSAGGYWPVQWGLYQTNRFDYFSRLDAVVRSAERHQIGLIPSLFWNLSAIPDLVGEPCNRWGDTHSKVHAFMKGYVREVVSRYRDSPAILAWEFGNEFTLAADLPNAVEHRPQAAPSLGTPRARTAADELTHDQIRIAFKAFAEAVRAQDSERLILSGNAFPRGSAWHQRKSRTWEKDTPEQFAEMLRDDNPDPMQALTVRAYEPSDFDRLDSAVRIGRTLRKPVFVGEFGVPGRPLPDQVATFNALLTRLDDSGVSLAALWVYDFNAQAADWNVTAGNLRRGQLEAVATLNRKWRQESAKAAREPRGN